MSLALPSFETPPQNRFATQELSQAIESSYNRWVFVGGFVTEHMLLQGMHAEALAVRAEYPGWVKRSPGSGVDIMKIPVSVLRHNPVIMSATDAIEGTLGKRANHAQVNYYPPGSGIRPHRDDLRSLRMHNVSLGVAGEGVFAIHAAGRFRYRDEASMQMNPGDLTVLAPLRKRHITRRYTTRSHSIENTGSTERVALVVSFL